MELVDEDSLAETLKTLRYVGDQVLESKNGYDALHQRVLLAHGLATAGSAVLCDQG